MTEADRTKAIETMAEAVYDGRGYSYSPFYSCCHSAEEHEAHNMQHHRSDMTVAFDALVEGGYVVLTDDSAAIRCLDQIEDESGAWGDLTGTEQELVRRLRAVFGVERKERTTPRLLPAETPKETQ